MDPDTRHALDAVNRRFYAAAADEFSDTRAAPWPGWERVLRQVPPRPAPLRVSGWPPATPMGRLRPLDQRFMTTCEFFPLAGDDFYLGVIASYFREPAEFPMILELPPDRRLAGVRELIADKDVPAEAAQGEVSIRVELSFDTPALIFRFDLAAGP